MPFSFADNTQRRVANAILAIDVPLAGYAYYVLRNQAETLTGPRAFDNSFFLILPVLFWGLAMGEWRSRQSLNFALVCLISLLFAIGSASHSTLSTITACVLLAVGLVWNWLAKNFDEKIG